MAETPADVRRDIELTRNRISDTLQELERKMNVAQIVKDNPWPALALAVGAGVLLSGSKADVKATAATLTATKGASSRLGSVLDDLVSQVVSGFHGAIEQKIEGLASEVKKAIGAPARTNGSAARSSSSFSTAPDASSTIPRAD
jgi:Tfp pilus assembly protein FimV